MEGYTKYDIFQPEHGDEQKRVEITQSPLAPTHYGYALPSVLQEDWSSEGEIEGKAVAPEEELLSSYDAVDFSSPPDASLHLPSVRESKISQALPVVSQPSPLPSATGTRDWTSEFDDILLKHASSLEEKLNKAEVVYSLMRSFVSTQCFIFVVTDCHMPAVGCCFASRQNNN